MLKCNQLTDPMPRLLLLLCCCITLCVIAIYLRSSHPIDARNTVKLQSHCGANCVHPRMTQAEPTPVTPSVHLTVYYESQCSDSEYFINRQLLPTWDRLNGHQTISSQLVFKLTMVPYGKATERKDEEEWKFSCQHGSEECYGNILHTCALYGGYSNNLTASHSTQNQLTPYTSVSREAMLSTTLSPEEYRRVLGYIDCTMVDGLPRRAHEKCARKFDLDVDSIKSCADSSYGNNLEHVMATLTSDLQPFPSFIPWLTINGTHTSAIQTEGLHNLLSLICHSYQGERPPGCR